MPPPELPGRRRPRSKRAQWYCPTDLATKILDRLEQMEVESDRVPRCAKYRQRTGLTCAAEFRGLRPSQTEDAITVWLAESFMNSESQVTDIVSNARPDIVLAYEGDEHGEDVFVFVEGKPIWQRWITDGARSYAGVVTDCCGRSTGNYLANNVRQLIGDRDKLLGNYTDARDRPMLLALVFQRPAEVDARIIESVGRIGTTPADISSTSAIETATTSG